MAGGALQERLNSEAASSGVPALTWHDRLGIASDVARGLVFLHTVCDPPIIHQDVKSANVLLTASSPPVAKVADFGTARMAPTLLDLSLIHI